jgi:hypothetical protein
MVALLCLDPGLDFRTIVSDASSDPKGYREVNIPDEAVEA